MPGRPMARDLAAALATWETFPYTSRPHEGPLEDSVPSPPARDARSHGGRPSGRGVTGPSRRDEGAFRAGDHPRLRRRGRAPREPVHGRRAAPEPVEAARAGLLRAAQEHQPAADAGVVVDVRHGTE